MCYAFPSLFNNSDEQTNYFHFREVSSLTQKSLNKKGNLKCAVVSNHGYKSFSQQNQPMGLMRAKFPVLTWSSTDSDEMIIVNFKLYYVDISI